MTCPIANACAPPAPWNALPLNEEIRRRERVIRIFPNEASAIRLIGALLIEIDDLRSTGKKYLNMDLFEEWVTMQEQETSTIHQIHEN